VQALQVSAAVKHLTLFTAVYLPVHFGTRILWIVVINFT